MTTSVYSLDFPADDLITWSKILSDMGDLLNHLGFLAERGGSDSEILPRVAQSLGYIVNHYANGINQLVTRSYSAINNHLTAEKEAEEAAKKLNQEGDIVEIAKKMQATALHLDNLVKQSMQN